MGHVLRSGDRWEWVRWLTLGGPADEGWTRGHCGRQLLHWEEEKRGTVVSWHQPAKLATSMDHQVPQLGCNTQYILLIQ